MITVATCLWAPNDSSFPFSRYYSEAWVEKLYRGFLRNLSDDFRFVCFVDREYDFDEKAVEQVRFETPEPIDYGAISEVFRLDEPMIFCGLDTVVVGNCDHLARHALEADVLAVPRDPFKPTQACNGVVVCPAGLRAQMWDDYDGRNDMEWIRANPHAFLDDLFPGHVVSFKGHTQHFGIEDETRIVYFHGEPKPPSLLRLDWIREHWR